MQIGFTPNSPYFQDPSFTGELATMYGDYLVFQNINSPSNLMLNKYTQEIDERPVLYPFYDNLMGSFKTFTPLFYQMAMTDETGVAEFSVDGKFAEHLIENYMKILHLTPLQLEDLNLYIRVFYSSMFFADTMKISEYSYIGQTVETDLLMCFVYR